MIVAHFREIPAPNILILITKSSLGRAVLAMLSMLSYHGRLSDTGHFTICKDFESLNDMLSPAREDDFEGFSCWRLQKFDVRC